MEQLQSHIWLTASSYRGNYLRISSYIRKPFLIYDFATALFWISLYCIWGKFDFLFYQCVLYCKLREVCVWFTKDLFWIGGIGVEQLGPVTNHPIFIIQLHNMQWGNTLFQLAPTPSFDTCVDNKPTASFSTWADSKLFQFFHRNFLAYQLNS